MPDQIDDFIQRWEGNSAGEMKVAQQHFLELCQALDVPPPSPGEAEAHTYCFERPVYVPGRTGEAPVPERIDVYKKDHFIWENKQGSEAGAQRVGHGRRGTGSWQVAMNRAFGQAVRYARNLNEFAPPFLVVCDVGHHIEIWSDFSRTGKQYADRPSRRLSYGDLRSERDRDYLRKVLVEPQALNPAVFQDRVTRAVAADLARIARSLEDSGHAPRLVARFLMRCVFTMFAEDTQLLPPGVFTNLCEQFRGAPSKLVAQLEHLWQLMDKGGFALGLGEVMHFNGGLFHSASALALTAEQVTMLHQAARHDWSEVEPTIFGTLVERALDPQERHRLGAHFTPRAYIERLVRPTVIEPLRDEWLGVRASVLETLGDGESTAPARKKAIGLLDDFHRRLCTVKVLDPACGTGNFLYVTYDLLKDLEAEVVRMRADLGETQTALRVEGLSVDPRQMLGIEKNPRAREIADLVLWIGHLQRLRRESSVGRIPEPILQESDHIECRDAVLAWDGEPIPRRDADGNIVRVWDQRSMKVDPVTGRQVPDESETVVVFDYPSARPAEWPEAEFVVSNPPFVGTKRMRAALGDGYVDTLRKVYADRVEDNADLVMYWWEKAAELLVDGAIRGFGFITTNSITQSFNRRVIQRALDRGVVLSFAVPDHPWVDGGAAVRISMSTGVVGLCAPRVGRIVMESGGVAEVAFRGVDRINADLSAGADVTSALKLEANARLCSNGVALHGKGFVLEPDEVSPFRDADAGQVVREYVKGSDLVRMPKERYVIDFSFMEEDEARAANPLAFQRVLDTVYPHRKENRRKAIRENWFRFGWERPGLREAMAGLAWYIATTETSKHRVFQFVDGAVLPDHMVLAFGLSDAWVLAVLSSQIHIVWSLAAGGRLGVGNDPRYNKTRCFDPFPFPELSDKPEVKARLADLGERLDAHRKAVRAKGRVAGIEPHLTNQYNALERARDARAGGPPLDDGERAFHEGALIGILEGLHRDIDAAACEAYGWPSGLEDEEILTRLVELNHVRAAEEAQGYIRWLRPEFQAPDQVDLELDNEVPDVDVTSADMPAAQQPWPKEPSARLLAVRDLLRVASHPMEPGEVRGRFKRARKKAVEQALDALVSLGVVSVDALGRYSAA